jgi:hypothetical protein
VGEVSAATADWALAGGPPAVSTRHPGDGETVHCSPLPEKFGNPDRDYPVVHTPSFVLSADATIEVHLG